MLKNFLRLLIFITMLSIPSLSFAVMEVSFEFGYDKNVYGQNRENKQTERTYSGSWAFYFWQLTGIELNYSQSKEITTENNKIDYESEDISVTGMQSTLSTEVYGIGIRQALASRKSRIIPMISMGYAKEFSTYERDVTLQVISTGESTTFSDDPQSGRTDSVFASFMLKLRVSRGLALKGSVRTMFPAFKMNQAKDSLQYTAGFSWMF